MTARRIDLDDTSGCPVGGSRCESCGAERDDLRVETATLGRLGVACFLLCPRCGDSGVVPNVAVGTAMRFVGQHCEHLGIDLDQMAEELDLQAGDR